MIPARLRRRWLPAAALALVAVPLAGQIRRWNPEKLFNSREFSHVTTSRNASTHVFISGQGPIRPGQSFGGRVLMRDQIQGVLANARDALDAVGATTDDVVEVHFHVSGYSLMDGIVIARYARTFFNERMPTSTFTPVSGLVWKDARVSMDMVVALPGE